MTPEEVFRALVRGVAAGDFEALPDLYAEQTDVRHPMHPAGGPPLRTRDELREHFSVGPKVNAVVTFDATNLVVHQTTDPEVIVAEFDYAGTSEVTGEPFRASNIFVMRIRDGQIVESRDYIDHLAMAKARGLVDQLIGT
ncbi:nuclear transport factor 2 family protein [Kribbella sp. NPDC026611]|uniref:nuclear transport factor 2 family protein n=1 Tax=Kribbella sp. NPDC026611 TaxID=3154911 RepID=UPI0033C0F96C